jgi:hypothetical protein
MARGLCFEGPEWEGASGFGTWFLSVFAQDARAGGDYRGTRRGNALANQAVSRGVDYREPTVGGCGSGSDLEGAGYGAGRRGWGVVTRSHVRGPP